ncbi:hypothetical protein ACTMU2_13880 [Cupriavidus basilensis]
MKGYKAKTEPGGTIIVQRAFTDAEGMVQAGWLVSASKYAGHTVVQPSVMARVDPVIYRDNAPASATVTVINPAMAQVVKSAEPTAGRDPVGIRRQRQRGGWPERCADPPERRPGQQGRGSGGATHQE